MKVQCKNCLPKEGIEIPDLTQSEKQQLWEWNQKSPLHAVKKLMEDNRFSHRNAKYAITHINKEYGQCNRCSFDKLYQEYVKCTQCGALNFNWMINKTSN